MPFPRIGSGGQGVAADIVDGWCISYTHRLVACLATKNIDLTAFDEAGQERAAAAFRSMFGALDHQISFVARVRPFRVTTKLFDDALVAWRRDTTVLIQTEHNVDRLKSAISTVSKSLSRAGIENDLVTGRPLRELLDETALSAAHPRYATSRTGFHRGIEVQRLPGVTVGIGWLDPVLRLRIPQDLAVGLSPLNSSQAMAMLKRRLRDHTSQQMATLHRTSMPDPIADAAMGNVSDLRRRLALGESRPLLMTITSIVHSDDLQQLTHAAALVRAAMAQVTAAGAELTFRHHDALRHASVLAAQSPSRHKLTTSDAAATATLWTQAEMAEPDGYLLGRDPHSLSPVQLDPFDARTRANANVAIFAASGQGKSYTVASLLLEAARARRSAIIVDPEGEYRNVVAALGGDYVDLGDAAAGRGFNIFTPKDDRQRSTDTLVEFTTLLCGGRLTSGQRSVLHRVAEKFLDDRSLAGRGAAMYATQVEKCLPEVGGVLSRFARRREVALFESPAEISADRVCAFNLRDVHHEILAPLAYVIANWIWNLITSDPRPRHIVFDEVGALSDHPALRHLLVQLSRRCRKYRAGLVVATQNVEDLMRTPEGSVIATNCATVLLGGHRASEASRMGSVFGLTDRQRDDLTAAPKGRFLLVTGATRMSFDVVPRSGHHDVIVGGPAG